MPEVHFIGSIDSVRGGAADDELCVTWALVPGNEEWYIQKGSFFGETQISSVSVDGCAVLNHPLDAQFNTESSEGWPRLVCELWHRESVMSLGSGGGESVRGLLGCGCTWLPACPGPQTLTVRLWKPSPTLAARGSLSKLADHLLPSVPDMERLRELVIDPAARATSQAHPAGEVAVSVHTLVTKDFASFGVNL
mmetsp:Transcript_5209/g.8578  ORF Transcript_5209/g.8578 Transcript_5209/m.8578 type:complete len:194 (+) Transcript_5209:122-703(+)